MNNLKYMRRLIIAFMGIAMMLIVGTDKIMAQDTGVTRCKVEYTGNIELEVETPGLMLRTAHGVRVGRHWMFGVGTGFGCSWASWFMPVYGQVRFDVPVHPKCSLFALTNLGVAHGFEEKQNGYYATVGLGVRYRRMTLQLGIEMVNLKYEISHKYDQYGNKEWDKPFGGPTLTLGYTLGAR